MMICPGRLYAKIKDYKSSRKWPRAFRAEVFSEAVADDFEDGRVIHESMESFCPGSTADDDDIFRRIEC